MISETRLQKIIGHFEYVQAKLAESPSQNELVSLSKEYAELKPICELIDKFKRVSLELSEAKELSSDPEFKEIMDAMMRQTRDATASTERGAILADFEAAFNAGEREFAQWLSQEPMIMRVVWNMAFDDEGKPPAPMQRMMALLGRYSR